MSLNLLLFLFFLSFFIIVGILLYFFSPLRELEKVREKDPISHKKSTKKKQKYKTIEEHEKAITRDYLALWSAVWNPKKNSHLSDEEQKHYHQALGVHYIKVLLIVSFGFAVLILFHLLSLIW